MATKSGLVTAQDLWDMPNDGYRYELVRGERVRTAPAEAEHGNLGMTIGASLYNHAVNHGLGRVYAAETGFLIGTDPDHVRSPDVAFVRQDRVAEAGRVTGFFPGAPDLAIEVISPNDLYTEVEEKVEDWLAAGAAMVILINPRNRTAILRMDGRAPVILTARDVLEGGEVVPGWSMTVGKIFEG